MTDLAIEIKDLKKTYNIGKKSEKEALKNINLKINKGSFFGLLGPNGAGKSTIINIMAGLVKKTSGSVNICGFDIEKEANNAKKNIGIVPQELFIDPFFNVFETLEIYAGYYGVKKQDRRTEEIITALGLKDKIYAKPRSLSGGMKRRLLVAKSLVHNPQIIVLDEPTAGVDVELRDNLWSYVKKLNEEQKTTIVLTTHYLEEAEELCNEIAIINNGSVIKCDKKKNLMNSLDEREIIIEISDNITKIPEQITQKLNTKLISPNKIVISYKSHEIEFSNILNILHESNLKITDFETKRADLEKIFKYLIRK
jgi:ABC-2 type transport system ATP-binding protein|tara:strand:+ start:16123 stop:17055 length:933 start_codon:yes stop_codon:yes gene_type:complete